MYPNYISSMWHIHHKRFQSNSHFCPFKMFNYGFMIIIFYKYFKICLVGSKKNVLPTCYSLLPMCVPPSRLTTAFLSRIQSGAMLSPLMGREWEDAGEEGPPWDHLGATLGPPGPQSHKNLHSQAVSLVFLLPWSKKHINYIYSNNAPSYGSQGKNDRRNSGGTLREKETKRRETKS